MAHKNAFFEAYICHNVLTYVFPEGYHKTLQTSILNFRSFRVSLLTFAVCFFLQAKTKRQDWFLGWSDWVIQKRCPDTEEGRHSEGEEVQGQEIIGGSADLWQTI